MWRNLTLTRRQAAAAEGAEGEAEAETASLPPHPTVHVSDLQTVSSAIVEANATSGFVFRPLLGSLGSLSSLGSLGSLCWPCLQAVVGRVARRAARRQRLRRRRREPKQATRRLGGGDGSRWRRGL